MSSAPIRQPRGPPSATAASPATPATTFTPPSAAAAAAAAGPPLPDAESLLRRNKTLATPRTGPPPVAAYNAAADREAHRKSFGAALMSSSYGSAGAGSGPGATAGATGAGGLGSTAATGSEPSSSSSSVAASSSSSAYGQSRFRSGSFSGIGDVPSVVPSGHASVVGVVGGVGGAGGSVGGAGVLGGDVGSGLVRRQSARDQYVSRVAPAAEETLVETEAADEHNTAATERAVLSSNGGVNPGLFPAMPSTTDPAPPNAPPGSMKPPPPPRPPRRVYNDGPSSPSAPPVSTHSRSGSSHTPSLSLSSLSMIVNSAGAMDPNNPGNSPIATTPGSTGHGTGYATPGPSVSRTQSLRAHMQPNAPQQVDFSTLGRSASMRTPGELSYSRNMHASPVPPNPFSAATPPRPGRGHPSLYAASDDGELDRPQTDIRRHQSLTYGTSARTRERLERSQALLSLDQREDLRRRLAASPSGSQSGAAAEGRRHSRHLSIGMDDNPANPIGRTVWTPGAGAAGGDDGWSTSSQQLQQAQQLQDALDALSLRDVHYPHHHQHQGLQLPQPGLPGGPSPHPGEEPAWVTNLVGMPGQPSPQPQPRSLGAPGGGGGGGPWDDRSAPSPYHGMPPPPPPQHWDAGAGLHPNMSILQQQQQLYAQAQQQLKLAASLGGGALGPVPVLPPMQLQPPFSMGGGGQGGYMGGGGAYTPGYPTPPGTAMGGAGGPGGGGERGAPGGRPGSAGPGGPGGGGGAPLSAQDLDVIELARSKGLNPATFDCRPAFARFFVIKSYTEDDVQKSLKHEIWSSTVLGNKRLDTAFRESHDHGPIYLFFSVNGSRHFCGVAQMLTPVDETQSSTVWAQDKWKGIFKVRWIFVRDVPTAALRHIRLTNTPERKPITNSRDTQELPYEAGCEVLQIFLEHQHKSKTSLLQDFAYYERLSATRGGVPGGPGGPGAAGTLASPQPPMSGHMTPTLPTHYGAQVTRV